MVELELQEAATMKVASAKHVATTTALRVGAAAASMAAAVLVITNHQERWGIEVNFTMFDVWVYVYLPSPISRHACIACFFLLVRPFIRSIALDRSPVCFCN